MSTAVAKTESNSLVSAVDAADFDKFEAVLSTARSELKLATNIRRAIVMAKAMSMLKASITPSMMKDFNELKDSPHGFKTDRPPGTKKKAQDGTFYNLTYSDDVVKNVIVQALLKGAMIVGNEFNIIAGQCYLTKEFFESAIKKLPNVRGFTFQIGPPKRHGEKSAILEGIATWQDANGNPKTIELIDKTSQEGGLDMRIVVNAFNSSSPDELRGKAESKLLRRAYQQMTGEYHPDSDELGGDFVDGTIVDSEPALLEENSEQETSQESTPEEVVVGDFLQGVEAEFLECKRIGDCGKVAKAQCEAVDGTKWSAQGKEFAKKKIAELRDQRIEQHRAKG